MLLNYILIQKSIYKRQIWQYHLASIITHGQNETKNNVSSSVSKRLTGGVFRVTVTQLKYF